MSDETTPPLERSPRGGWFQVDEGAIQKLAASFNKASDTRNAMFCYMVLCRKANLKRSWVFEDTIQSMANDLHMAYRDAQGALELLEATGLLRIERRKIPGTKANAPSIYTVIRPSDNLSVPSDITSEASRIHSVCDEYRSSPKKSPRDPQEGTKREASASLARFIPPTATEAEAEALKNGMPSTEGQAFIDHYQANGWIFRKSPMHDWQAAMRAWKQSWSRFPANPNQPSNGHRPNRFDSRGQSVAEIRKRP